MTKKTVPLKDVMARFSPESRARIEARAAELIAEEATLADLRKAHELTQQAMAESLGIKQESVSNIESRSDMLLSTLRNYVQAMGGELKLIVRFANRPPVSLTSLADALGKASAQPVRRRQKIATSKPRRAAARAR